MQKRPEGVGSLESGVLSPLFLDFRLPTSDSRLSTPDLSLKESGVLSQES